MEVKHVRACADITIPLMSTAIIGDLIASPMHLVIQYLFVYLCVCVDAIEIDQEDVIEIIVELVYGYV